MSAEARRFDIDAELAPSRSRRLARLPSLVRIAVRTVHEAAPRELAASLVLEVLGAAGIAGQFLVGRRLLELLLSSAGTGTPLEDLAPTVLLFSGLSAVVLLSGLARAELQAILGQLTGRHTVQRVIDVATQVDLVRFDDPDFHDRLQRAHLNAVTRPVQIVAGLVGLMHSGFIVLGGAVALLLIDPILLGLVLLSVLPGLVLSRRIGRLQYALVERQTPLERRRNYFIQILAGKDASTEVRAFGLRHLLGGRLDVVWGAMIDGLRELARAKLRLSLAGAGIAAVLTTITLLLMASWISQGRLTLDEAGVAAGAVLLLGNRFRGIGSSAGSLYEGSLFLEDFTDFAAELPALREAARGTEVPASFDELTAHDITFTYPSRSEPTLRGVSIAIRRGQVIALVGRNGSGKTTLAKVLAGLYRPATGVVRWDGVDVATMASEQVRRQITTVFQDFMRYHLSLRENIALGRPDDAIDDPAVLDAAVRAGADSVARSLEEGYDTVLGPEFLGGSNLSVGQWQRVAIARAFYRDTPLVILDEPTASLDARGEHELFQQVRNLFADRTVLLISHRFSTVRFADRIHVLEEGRIVEAGTHRELVELGGQYADMYQVQAAAYQDPVP